MAEEWVKEARNDVRNEVYFRLETKKALGATKEERERSSAEAGLKNAQTQSEDQRKLLY